MNGRKHRFRANLTNMRKVVLEHALLGSDLRARLDMLHGTSAADTETFTTRLRSGR
jgi:hypothetical protein